jgi:hypothetical protein
MQLTDVNDNEWDKIPCYPSLKGIIVSGWPCHILVCDIPERRFVDRSTSPSFLTVLRKHCKHGLQKLLRILRNRIIRLRLHDQNMLEISISTSLTNLLIVTIKVWIVFDNHVENTARIERLRRTCFSPTNQVRRVCLDTKSYRVIIEKQWRKLVYKKIRRTGR